MAQLFSFLPFFKLSRKAVELPVFHRQIVTETYRLNSLKVNGNGLVAAGNEDGVVLVVNLLSEGSKPQQVRYLGFEFGGVSDLCWIDRETLAVGTTRGWIVIYSSRNEAARFLETCKVKAHGDGASHVSVESIDYCPHTQSLASVGEGVGSIKLWKVSPEDGQLTPLSIIPEITAYHLPRFVAFTENGGKVTVGYLQNGLLQSFSLRPWKLIEEHVLGEDLSSHLGNASFIDSAGSLAVFNLKQGVDIYDTSTFARRHTGLHPVDDLCNQGLAVLRGGAYLASAARDAAVYIFKTYDASLAVKLRVPGRGHRIDAIHASKFGNCEVLVASSCATGQPSVLTVWCHQEMNQITPRPTASSEHPTFRLVVLCILVSLASHFMASITPFIRQDVWSGLTGGKTVQSLPETYNSHDIPDHALIQEVDQDLGFRRRSPSTSGTRLVSRTEHQAQSGVPVMEVIIL